jgi:D-psicose/D-tagatose/L-ribulose 3-epimerase
MRLAISNIAWDISEDHSIAELLLRNGIDAIDIAPSKYFPILADVTDGRIKQVRSWWADRGIQITGMQALMFGTVGLNMFGSANVRHAMLEHLAGICRIGAGLGAKNLVFGSPKNRDRSGLSYQESVSVAVQFFRALGDTAAACNVQICLEPNPSRYGANFMMTSEETAEIVEKVAHPAIKMQLDIGALTINDEDTTSVLEKYAYLIGHVHISEPDLLPIGDGNTDHQSASLSLQQYLPKQLASIEMLATKNESHLVSIQRALKVVMSHYGAISTKASS